MRFCIYSGVWAVIIGVGIFIAPSHSFQTSPLRPLQCRIRKKCHNPTVTPSPNWLNSYENSSIKLQLGLHSSTVAASCALIASSTLGTQCERWIPGSGILGTLTSAAFISNIFPLVPVVHPLYDLCWSWILPGSLAMLLLGFKATETESSLAPRTKIKSRVMAAIARVGGPFVMASVGSIFGCWTAFQWGLPWFAATAQARATASCLSASYVGGSVNLFATAKIIQAPASLLSSMATADLIAMAFYFSVLSSTLEWRWLRGLFHTYDGGNPDASIRKEQKYSVVGMNTTLTVSSKDEPNPVQSLSTTSILLSLNWFIVWLANIVESRLGRWIPGTACGVIAMLAPTIRSIFQRQSLWRLGIHSHEWSTIASTLADWFFLLFFASIGVGVDLTSTIQMGPACLFVSMIALAIHLLVTVIGSKLLLPTQRWGIALEDLWIASNAAIGGPATAAAFCNRMKNDRRDEDLLLGRTVAATVWGVVGYAIGTLVGVGLYKFLGGA